MQKVQFSASVSQLAYLEITISYHGKWKSYEILKIPVMDCWLHWDSVEVSQQALKQALLELNDLKNSIHNPE